MDTVTHALVGTAISDSWFRKRLGPVATPFALAASSLPDLDMVAYFVSPEYAWSYHRGYSHSIFVFLLAAPLLGYAGYRFSSRAGSCLEWILLTFLCLAAHTFGDLLTGWGTMPLLPFSNARISWDIVPILDLFMTAVASASFLLNRLLRWEKTDTFPNPLAFPVVHKHPRRQKAAGIVAGVCVCLLGAYVALGWHQNRQAVRRAWKELAATGVEPVEVRALPFMFTYISYGIAARDARGTVYNAVYSSLAPKPMLFNYYPTVSGAAVEAAKRAPEGRMFAWYSQNMYVATSEKMEDGVVVRLRDRRFFLPLRQFVSMFTMEFKEDENERVTGVKAIHSGAKGMDLGGELRALWNLTRYGEVHPAK